MDLRSIFLGIPDDPDTFFEPNGKSTRGFNQIHINAFFSVLDKKFTDLLVQPSRKRNEYSAFCQMVDRSETDAPVIYLCDRGYASYNAFAHVIENGQFFLIRCTDAKTEKILGAPLDGITELDYHVDRILSRSQSKKKRLHPELEEQYRFVCQDVPMDYITQNHPEYKLSLRIISRWNEETSFRDLKYPLCLKAFHSKKYEYIVQEVWVRAILYNFCSEIALAVEIPEKKRKHVYQVNYSEAIKTCRDFLRIHDGATTLDVEGLIAQNILPVRPGRTFARQARFKLPISFCYRN